MSSVRCHPYEPDFLACVGLPPPERWYPYGPGGLERRGPAPVPPTLPADLLHLPQLAPLMHLAAPGPDDELVLQPLAPVDPLPLAAGLRVAVLEHTAPEVAPVPEPAVLALLALAVLVARARR